MVQARGLWCLRGQRQITQLSGARRPESYSPAAATYRAAIARWPDDWTLREQSASYFHTQGHPAEAEEHWRKLIELLPHSEHPYYGLASLCVGVGQGESTIVEWVGE